MGFTYTSCYTYASCWINHREERFLSSFSNSFLTSVSILFPSLHPFFLPFSLLFFPTSFLPSFFLPTFHYSFLLSLLVHLELESYAILTVIPSGSHNNHYKCNFPLTLSVPPSVGRSVGPLCVCPCQFMFHIPSTGVPGSCT